MSFKSEKIEINFQRIAFGISLVMHMVIIFLVFSIGKSFVHTYKVIVVDFSLEDSLKVETGTSEHIKSKPFRKPALSNHVVDVESRETPVKKKKSPIEDTTAKIEPAEIQNIKPLSSGETQPNDTAFSEQSTSYEDKNMHNAVPATSASAHHGSGGSTDRDVTGINVKSTYGGVSGNTVETKKTGYLRANFSYIKNMIKKRITYPQNARRMGWEGKVKVSFIISSSGEVRDIKLIQSSGYGILDNNVIDAVHDASPFPKPPAEARIIIPIVYSLH
jgi:TonB family protein